MYRIEVFEEGFWEQVAEYQDIRSAKSQFTKLVTAHPSKQYRRIAVHEVYEAQICSGGGTEPTNVS